MKYRPPQLYLSGASLFAPVKESLLRIGISGYGDVFATFQNRVVA